MIYIQPGTTLIRGTTDSDKVIQNGIASPSKTTVSIGHKVSEIAYIDLEKAPHELIAGCTGSGKSVCINTQLFELLSKNDPTTLALYIIDPKMVDYIEYKYIPHTKMYETDIDGAESVLMAIKAEMMKRYKTMQMVRVNHASKANIHQHIVLVFDEYASLMNAEGRARLQPLMNEIARLGRAAKISMILATQYPSRDIIDSQLKANCPTRICFRVASTTNSRVILDQKGGELLKGNGDGILISSDGSKMRFQGAMVNEDSMRKLFSFLEPQPFSSTSYGYALHKRLAQ